ncbi:transporter substrate-binding domain-containing protein [Vitiosangium sp. GDMCC 1.1324]|uniref:transporter substrate-binding domain-containing protein n=1 Tax=Vitiosangium sp. (strain GDMCC 1.1324) TaxID=2138576 RepID=UPI000D37493B|nr:transporter substrate-binding domain-containing protein [Vitiosangium sp. GDMCC 1.1324]PTL85090.1 ABC transporter substrate-binding protein [Vitiosangium sp. GDMCC 1.1324]
MHPFPHPKAEEPRETLRKVFLAGTMLVLLAACAAHPGTVPPSRETRVLRVGTSGDYPPFSTLRDGQASGFDAALMESYAADRGYRLEWVRFRWPELVADLGAHRFDVATSGITLRPERSLAGRYTVPVARNGALLLLRRPAWAPPPGSSTPEEPLALLRALDRPEFRVAVNRGGHLERVARAHFKNARILAIPDNAAVREALANGEVDAALTNTVEGPRWAEGLSGIERVGPFTRNVVALYVEPSRAELAADLDTWLLQQEESGALERLRAQYLGPAATGPTATPVDALLSATAERLALMPMVAAAKQRAGQPIEVPAQEARVLEAARKDVHAAAAALRIPAPPDEAITTFFQAQMDAAKQIQLRTPTTLDAPVHSLDDELRPALARISSRISALVPRVPGGLDREATRRKAREELASTGLKAEEIDRLADALVELGATRRAPATVGP